MHLSRSVVVNFQESFNRKTSCLAQEQTIITCLASVVTLQVYRGSTQAYYEPQ